MSAGRTKQPIELKEDWLDEMKSGQRNGSGGMLGKMANSCRPPNCKHSF